MAVPEVPCTSAERAWQDVAQSAGARVDALMAAMTLREKVAQLYGLWVGADSRTRHCLVTIT